MGSLRAWVGVVSRAHVLSGLAKLCQGKRAPRAAMRRGDCPVDSRTWGTLEPRGPFELPPEDARILAAAIAVLGP